MDVFTGVKAPGALAVLLLAACAGAEKPPASGGGGDTVEVCDNAADDDGDGLADCADDDCACTERLCDDGTDDDKDGLTDCADPDCVGSCPEVCADGLDNDGDGATDCDDEDCLGDCPEVCDDGLDNDGDGATDCADPDCDGGCPEACDDLRDNDGDGIVDCADPDCDGACPEVCDDGRDNDGDGATDCDDDECRPTCAELCGDGVDNDGDGDVDCDDRECLDVCDGDRDGYRHPGVGGDDCDDTDPAVNPGADEVCDAAGVPIDNDCDGLVDAEDPTWRSDSGELLGPDEDGDGWGRGDGVLSCPRPGHGPIGDCNDADPAIHPDADEVCQLEGLELDDDCNDLHGEHDPGIVGDVPVRYYDRDQDGYGDPTDTEVRCDVDGWWIANGLDCDDDDARIRNERLWYADADGDGYGAPGVGEGPSCRPPGPGLVSNDADCDDADPTVPLEMDRLCGPLACDRVDCDDTRIVHTGAAVATFRSGGELNDDDIAPLGDVDGDGIPDILLGDVGAFDGAGAGFVVSAASVGVVDLEDAPLIVRDDIDDGFADVIGGLGDLDGDGHGDFAVGSYVYSQTLLFDGPLAGAAGPADAAAILTADDFRLGAGHVASAGDVDGDGLDDVLAGRNGLYVDEARTGAVALLFGPVSGPRRLEDAGATFWSNPGTVERVGLDQTGLGDLDGDGVDDIAIRADFLEFDDEEGISVWYGPVLPGDHAIEDADAIVMDTSSSASHPVIVGGHDIDGDGRTDLATQESVHGHGGRILLATPIGPMDLRLDAEVALWGFTDGVRGMDAGDLDGDGRPDLVVGVDGDSWDASEPLAAYILHNDLLTGRVDRSAARTRIVGPVPDGEFGGEVYVVDDATGDGADELLVTSHDEAYLLHGPL